MRQTQERQQATPIPQRPYCYVAADSLVLCACVCVSLSLSLPVCLSLVPLVYSSSPTADNTRPQVGPPLLLLHKTGRHHRRGGVCVTDSKRETGIYPPLSPRAASILVSSTAHIKNIALTCTVTHDGSLVMSEVDVEVIARAEGNPPSAQPSRHHNTRGTMAVPVVVCLHRGGGVWMTPSLDSKQGVGRLLFSNPVEPDTHPPFFPTTLDVLVCSKALRQVSTLKATPFAVCTALL